MPLNLTFAPLGAGIYAPAFADTTTGALAQVTIAPIAGFIIEMRCQTNIMAAQMANAPDLEQMRADELNNLWQSQATI